MKHVSDTQLAFKMYKELLKINTQVLAKLAKELNRHFTKDDIEMANKHIKKMVNIIGH